MTTAYDFSARTLDGEEQPLAEFKGKPMLIVNTASKCGFTPQYTGLEKLWRDYGPRGLVVLGFPCDQFGRQEPGSNDEISRFCREQYQVTFPLFAKIDVNGPSAHPLFVFLKSQKKGLLGSTAIKWNFTKFLVGREGQVLKRYGSMATPEQIEGDVVNAL